MMIDIVFGFMLLVLLGCIGFVAFLVFGLIWIEIDKYRRRKRCER